MRYLTATITIALLVFGTGESNAQVCKSKNVAAGYTITAKDGYRYSCCQGYTGGGSCIVTSCALAPSGSHKYQTKFTKSNCKGSLVK